MIIKIEKIKKIFDNVLKRCKIEFRFKTHKNNKIHKMDKIFYEDLNADIPKIINYKDLLFFIL